MLSLECHVLEVNVLLFCINLLTWARYRYKSGSSFQFYFNLVFTYESVIVLQDLTEQFLDCTTSGRYNSNLII